MGLSITYKKEIKIILPKCLHKKQDFYYFYNIRHRIMHNENKFKDDDELILGLKKYENQGLELIDNQIYIDPTFLIFTIEKSKEIFKEISEPLKSVKD